MFQPRGEEGEEKEVTEWRIKKFLRMQNNSKRPQFRKPAEMPMTGPSGCFVIIYTNRNLKYFASVGRSTINW